MILRIRLFLLCLGLALATAGCHEHSLTRQQLSSLGELEVVVCVFQRDLMVSEIPEREPFRTKITTTSGKTDQTASAIVSSIGNVLQGIDEARRQRKLDERAQAMMQVLASYDFRADVLEATKTELAKVTTVRIVVRPGVDVNCKQTVNRVIFERSAAANVLFYGVVYSLGESMNQQVLTFNGGAGIFSKSNVLHGARTRPDPTNPVAHGNAVYSRRFRYEVPYDGRRDIREIFRNAAFVLAAQLAADLEPAK